jgi:hypothetical protein
MDKLVTIYTKNEFFGNIVKREGRLSDMGTQKYAQYNKAPFVKYIPKGKRKLIGFVQTFNPYLIVLEGYGHPEPQSMFSESKASQSNLIVKESTYQSFDKRYSTDFDSILDSYLNQNKINPILDCRYTKGYSPF